MKASNFEKITKVMARAYQTTPEDLLNAFRPAKVSELKELVPLRKAVFAEDISWHDLDYLKWRYCRKVDGSNPDAETDFWILRLKNKIVGGIGLEDIQLTIDGATWNAVKAMDAIVTPEEDGKGIGAWINLAIQEKNPLVIALGGNESSRTMLKKIFQPMRNRTNFKALINSQIVISYKLTQSKLSPPLANLIGHLIGPMVDLILQIKNAKHKPKLSDEFSIQHYDSFQQVFTPNNKTAPQSVALAPPIQLARSESYLAWRFDENPRSQFKITALYKNNQLAGYMVYIMEIEQSLDRLEGVIIDWQLYTPPLPSTEPHTTEIEQTKEMFKALLFATLGEIRKFKPAVALTNCYDAQFQEIFKACGFKPSDDEINPFFTFTQDENLQEQLYNSDNWFLTLADIDSF